MSYVQPKLNSEAFTIRHVAVACGARLSCSVFMVYSVLLFVSLRASASI